MIKKAVGAFRQYKMGIFFVLLNRLLPDHFKYKSLVIFAFDLQNQEPILPGTDKDVEVRRVEDAQDKIFKQFRQKYPAPEFLRRINQEKETAYIAFKEGEIVAYAWVTEKEMSLNSINYIYPLDKDEAFLYSCYVSLEHRGEKIHSLMLYERLQDCIRRGNYTTAYVAVLATNKGSIKGVKRAGFKEIKKIRYVKFLGLEKRWGLE